MFRRNVHIEFVGAWVRIDPSEQFDINTKIASLLSCISVFFLGQKSYFLLLFDEEKFVLRMKELTDGELEKVDKRQAWKL